jgi:hypothetical protein
MELAVPTASQSAWLRGLPKCRREGRMVYVTLNLDSTSLKRPTTVAWSAGGLHATTPKTTGPVVTCCIPHGVFEDRASVKLELLDSPDSERPIFAWSQILVLGEVSFRAGLNAGVPTLTPFRSQKETYPAPVRRERTRSVAIALK